MMGIFNLDENSGHGKEAMLGCSFACLDLWTMYLGILIPQYLAKLPGHPSSQCLTCTDGWICPLCIKTKHFSPGFSPKRRLFIFLDTSLKALGQRRGVAWFFGSLEISSFHQPGKRCCC